MITLFVVLTSFCLISVVFGFFVSWIDYWYNKDSTIGFFMALVVPIALISSIAISIAYVTS